MLKGAIATLVDELAAMVEPSRPGARRRTPYLIVERGGQFECYRADRRRLKRLREGRIEDLSRRRLPRPMRSRPVEVRLDEARLLTKTLQLPAASRNYLDAIVGHQMERMTPWTADRVVFDYELVGDDPSSKEHITVRLVATSREAFDAALAPLLKAGVKPLAVGTSGDPLDKPSAINLLQANRLERRMQLRRRVAAGLTLVVALGVAVSAFTGWRLYTTNAQAAAVQDELNTTRNAIDAARSNTEASESYARLIARKTDAVPLVVLVDKLSEMIPADTYLTALEVHDQQVRVAGSSTDAPGLVGTLEASDLLSNAHFAAPTTRDEAAGRDRFEIVADINPPAAAK